MPNQMNANYLHAYISYYYFWLSFYWPIFLEITPGWAGSAMGLPRRNLGILVQDFFYWPDALPVA